MDRFDSKNQRTYPVRPHHGMCLAYFKGEGYSGGFTAHMQEMLDIFMENATVRLTVETDEICLKCPNNRTGICITEEQVAGYDRAVLEICRLSEGQQLTFEEFAKTVEEALLSKGIRKTICGDCQWNSICTQQPSRWATTFYE